MELKDFQTKQPWTVPYSSSFTYATATVPHLYGTHTVLHAIKSLGKISTIYERADHSVMGVTEFDKEQIAACAADLITAAIRFANLHGFDIEKILIQRIQEKNGVDITK